MAGVIHNETLGAFSTEAESNPNLTFTCDAVDYLREYLIVNYDLEFEPASRTEDIEDMNALLAKRYITSGKRFIEGLSLHF